MFTSTLHVHHERACSRIPRGTRRDGLDRRAVLADPVGIIRTATGIVSLGLQLYGGISAYIEAVGERGEDLATASRHLQGLQSSLRIIQATIPTLPRKGQDRGDTVLLCLQICEEELKALEKLLGILVNAPVKPSNFIAKVKEEKKRLSFPFHRPNLIKLEERLQRANAVLRAAMHTLEL